MQMLFDLEKLNTLKIANGSFSSFAETINLLAQSFIFRSGRSLTDKSSLADGLR